MGPGPLLAARWLSAKADPLTSSRLPPRQLLECDELRWASNKGTPRAFRDADRFSTFKIFRRPGALRGLTNQLRCFRSRFGRSNWTAALNPNCVKGRDSSLTAERKIKLPALAREGTPISRLKAASALTRSRQEADRSNAIRYQRADQQTNIVWICHREVMQL